MEFVELLVTVMGGGKPDFMGVQRAFCYDFLFYRFALNALSVQFRVNIHNCERAFPCEVLLAVDFRCL